MNAWGSQCQPDVRKLFHTVLPFGCILAGPFPAEERHRETRLGARGEGGGEFKLTHYRRLIVVYIRPHLRHYRIRVHVGAFMTTLNTLIDLSHLLEQPEQSAAVDM
jgi:hypothetical protein